MRSRRCCCGSSRNDQGDQILLWTVAIARLLNLLHRNTHRYCSLAEVTHLQLLQLMKHAGIPHLRFGNNAEQVISKVVENFCPQMTDAQAATHMEQIISTSANALMPEFMEFFHKHRGIKDWLSFS